MKKRYFLSIALVLGSTFAFADDETLIKTRVVLDYPTTVDLEKLKIDLKDAIKFRAVDKTEEVNNFMPDDLPPTAGDVTFPENGMANAGNSMFSSMISNSMTNNGQMVAMSANMKGAVYGIKGYAASGYLSNKQYEGYVGAVYPYEKGYRVYIYSFFNKNRDMIGKAADWIVGKTLIADIDMGYSNTIQVRDKLLENEPNATIKRQDPSWLSQYKLSTANTVVKIESSPNVAIKQDSSAAK